MHATLTAKPSHRLSQIGASVICDETLRLHFRSMLLLYQSVRHLYHKRTSVAPSPLPSTLRGELKSQLRHLSSLHPSINSTSC